MINKKINLKLEINRHKIIKNLAANTSTSRNSLTFWLALTPPSFSISEGGFYKASFPQ